MTDKEKIVDKIRKLLALSESPNEHEAMLAMENANKLLMKYNLEMSDVSESVDLNNIIENNILSGMKLASFKTNLLSAVMRLNNCEIIIHNRIRGEKTIKALGKRHNIEVSVSMYEYLNSTLDRLSSKRDKRLNSLSFKLGFAHSISQKVDEILRERNKKQNEFDTQCTALVIQEKALVRNFIKQQYPNLRTISTSASVSDRQGYMAGKMAGDSVSLNGQIK
jgi:hypothetical protein